MRSTLCPHTGEVIYRSRREAAREADRLSNPFIDAPGVYHCSYCWHWHIGSLNNRLPSGEGFDYEEEPPL